MHATGEEPRMSFLSVLIDPVGVHRRSGHGSASARSE